ncbi:MAG TPA: thioredoxin domain-containing protein [Clostridiaceae bacterium]
MERESFEDKEVAKVLNDNFIAIKVDKEERPDIDQVYMSFCQAINGQGGWPLTIIMAPDKAPFFAGTYIPKEDTSSSNGLITLLEKVSKLWSSNKKSLIEYGSNITNLVNNSTNNLYSSSEDVDDESLIDLSFNDLVKDFESHYGGFGRSPKFPVSYRLNFLLRYYYVHNNPASLSIVNKTLESMHKGGIYDHIGFGFCRYSTDEKWLVPHFEKMLYDNALLAITYLEGYQLTKNQTFKDVSEEILTYIKRDMTSKEGGFYSAEDADSEGVEGKFYLWTSSQVIAVLGEVDGTSFNKLYDITAQGNFEGLNIPNLIKTSTINNLPPELKQWKNKLFLSREDRIHPLKDDKILTSWNGLMIAAFSIASRVLNDSDCKLMAENAADFILKELSSTDGGLMARYRQGAVAYNGYLDDYAFLIYGLIELYETSYKPKYLKEALRLNKYMLEHFEDKKNGGFFFTADNGEELLIRPKEYYDGALPSGNSVAAYNLVRLARLTDDSNLEQLAGKQINTVKPLINTSPKDYTFMLLSLISLNQSRELKMVGKNYSPDNDPMIRALCEDFNPFTLSLYYSERFQSLKDIIPSITEYKSLNGMTTAYFCKNFSCLPPIISLEDFRKILK